MQASLPKTLQLMLAQRAVEVEQLQWLKPEAVPQPYRDLLVHDQDMTSTLQRFHQSEISLEVIQCIEENEGYFREVILRDAKTSAPVEYGTIQIHLDAFSENAREIIIAGRTPLGSVLSEFNLAYKSQPHGFFVVNSQVIAEDLFSCEADKFFYGRHNRLANLENKALADIIEIIPPIEI